MNKQDFQTVYSAGIKLMPKLKTASTYPIKLWLESYDIQTEILPAIELVGKRKPSMDCWRYITPVIEEESLKREAEASLAIPDAPISDADKAKNIRTAMKYGVKLPNDERWLLAYENNKPPQPEGNGGLSVVLV